MAAAVWMHLAPVRRTVVSALLAPPRTLLLCSHDCFLGALLHVAQVCHHLAVLQVS